MGAPNIDLVAGRNPEFMNPVVHMTPHGLQSQGISINGPDNITVDQLEATVASLEDVPRACAIATASGMAAVTQAVMAFVKRGDRILVHRSVCLWANEFFIQELPKFGVKVQLVDLFDLSILERELQTPTKAVFFETLSNPTLEMVDLVKADTHPPHPLTPPPPPPSTHTHTAHTCARAHHTHTRTGPTWPPRKPHCLCLRRYD